MNLTGEQITPALIDRASMLLFAAAPSNSRIFLFGSRAVGSIHPESDVDFLVVEPLLVSRHREMVRFGEVLRPLRIIADVVVVSRSTFEQWSTVYGTLLYDVVRQGRELFAVA